MVALINGRGIIKKTIAKNYNFFVKKPLEKLTKKLHGAIIYRNEQVDYVFCRFYAKDEYERRP